VRIRDFAKPPLKQRFKNATLTRFGMGTTPSAPLRKLRNISLVAATPPNLGGDTRGEKYVLKRKLITIIALHPQ
jgi:hypothetical protein